MLMNWINRFGVKQRCMEGDRLLLDLFSVSVHYERDRNFYIYEDDFRFLGVVNRKVLRQMAVPPEHWNTLTLKDVCKRTEDNILISRNAGVLDLLCDAFENQFCYTDEIAVIEEETERLVGIYKRREVFHEKYPVAIENDDDIICYREKSQYYDRVKTKDNLSRYSKNVNSQLGEDGIIAEIFKRLGATSKYAVEFGGWDGVHLSNIRRLITEEGFRGLFIEGDSGRAKICMKNYEDYPDVHCVNTYVDFRGEHTLDSILKAESAPEQIDLVSIDIDGYDYHVWEAFQEYRPRVVVIEYNPTVQNDVVMINPRNESTFCGSSAAALVELGRKKGYSLAATTTCNLLFVVDEEYDKLQVWDNELSELRGERRISDGRYFQTYNKQFILTGEHRYLWGDAFIEKPYVLSDRSEKKFILSGI